MRSRRFMPILISLAAVSAALPAIAANEFTPEYSVGPVISTLGLGLEAGARLDDLFGLRINGNGFSFSANRDVRNVHYDGDATLESFGALVDLHPFRDGWRLSAGMRLNLNEVDLKGTPTNSTYTIHGTTYTATEVGQLNGKIAFNRFSPYIGVGYEGAVSDHWRLGFDLGAMYHGTPRVSLDATGPVTSTPSFNQQLEDERQELRDDVKDYSWYPVVGVTLKYAF
ncbi:MAG: hypothetical protein PW843_05295 [Azospirillaceae bacterium]|nr:hypothetical protein [Azospirillaceae bacterium]